MKVVGGTSAETCKRVCFLYSVWNDLENFVEIARLNRPEFENGRAMARSKIEPKIGGSKGTWSCNGKHVCIACIPCHLCGDVSSMHALTCSLHACMAHTCIIYACTSYACIIHVCVSSPCMWNVSIHAFMHACVHARVGSTFTLVHARSVHAYVPEACIVHFAPCMHLE